MCGFFVVKPKTNKILINKKKFINCTKMMTHRGPDDLKFYFDENICMGFNRLSIIDLSNKGAQPFQENNSNQVLVFNGFISNSEELKLSILNNKKYLFKGQSDTEILFKLLDNYGDKTFDYIRGMYSFVSYNKKKNSLLVARDPIGIKPLYYFEDQNLFIFSSEIKPIIQFTKKKNISNESVLNYFFAGSQDFSSKTFFSDVNSIKSGSYLKINNNRVTSYKSFFNLYDDTQKYKRLSKKLSYQIYEKKFSQLINEYIYSDVNCGSFLSSGIDSSYIAKTMSKKLNYNIETFTYGFQNFLSEDIAAKKFAKNYNLKSNIIALSPLDVINNIEKVIKKIESPITSIRLIAVDKLYSLVKKKNIKVILEGTGGDEALGGYKYNFYQYLKDKYKNAPKKFIEYVLVEASKSKNFYKKFADIITTLNNQNGSTTDGTPFVYSSLFNYEFLNQNLNEEFFFSKKQSYFNKLNFLQKSQYKDIYEIKLPKLLNYSDKIAMSYSVETRFPYLDQDYFKFCFNLKNSVKFNNFESRWPSKIFFSKDKKIGQFGNKKSIVDPQKNWISNDLYDFIYDNFNSNFFSNLPYFNKKKLIKLMDNIKKNDLPTSYNIFQILTFAIFYKKFFS